MDSLGRNDKDGQSQMQQKGKENHMSANHRSTDADQATRSLVRATIWLAIVDFLLMLVTLLVLLHDLGIF